MGDWTELKTADGHQLRAYVASPAAAPTGAVVILQEIFGVNGYIRSVADSYAAEGYLAIAPSLFDRVERGVELTYEGEDMKKAFALMQQLDPKTALLDIDTAFEYVRKAERGVGVVGFCYGGFLSWLSATRGDDVRMRPDCCVGFYPGGIGNVAAEEPNCPVMLHFGKEDTHIGEDQIEAVRAAHPEVQIFLYEGAGHGFACDARASFHAGSSQLARERTLEFLKTHIS